MIGSHPDIDRAVKTLGWLVPTPIQAQVELKRKARVPFRQERLALYS